jgi:aldehyde:ferredoxin oxidoreductase
VWTLVRLYNLREGFGRDDDALPAAIAGASGGEDASDSAADEPTDRPPGVDPEAFENLLDRYYAAREWDAAGRPTDDLLERLGLTGLAADPISPNERADPG